MSGPGETGWLPDCVFTGDKFERGLAFFADGLGRISRFSRAEQDLARAKRLPGQAALPGLVNGFGQSIYRTLRGRLEGRRAPAPNWADWTALATARMSPEDLYDAARMTFLEMMLAGITCTAEHSVLGEAGAEGGAGPAPAAVLRAAHDLGLRLALIAEEKSAGASEGAEPFAARMDALRAFVTRNHPADEAWLGLATAGPGDLTREQLRGAAAYAHTHRLRLFVPVSERAEDNHRCLAAHARRPVRLLAEDGLLGKRFTALHAAEIDEDEAGLLGAAKTTVCVCPSAGQMLGKGLAPVASLLAHGALVSIGSGTQARINLFAEARIVDAALHAGRPAGAAPGAVFQALTVAGSRSLGAPGGALEVGRPADFFTVNLFDPSIVGAGNAALLANVFYALERRGLRDVWVGARQRVTGGRHPLQGIIIGRFAELQRRLWGES